MICAFNHYVMVSDIRLLRTRNMFSVIMILMCEDLLTAVNMFSGKRENKFYY